MAKEVPASGLVLLSLPKSGLSKGKQAGRKIWPFHPVIPSGRKGAADLQERSVHAGLRPL